MRSAMFSNLVFRALSAIPFFIHPSVTRFQKCWLWYIRLALVKSVKMGTPLKEMRPSVWLFVAVSYHFSG